MKKNNDWAQNIAPMKTESCDFKRISDSVRKRIEAEKGNGITMTKKTKIRPLIIAAAITATAAVSIISVNAATDGAITDAVADTVTKVKCFINGEETDAYLVDSGVDESGNEYMVYQLDAGDEDSTSINMSIECEENSTDKSAEE